mgnify:CR=1 FL=1
MLNFKPSKLTLALLSSGLIALSTPTFAAEDAEAAKKNAEEEVEVIQVTGFRKSVVESINLKRYSSNVVETISAEDIGQLPDSSIAESIARLPGLAAQRIDGRASKVSLRGFGENESGTTLNGREQVSIGDNRGVEFDLYPSEIMSGVTVYKTPNASLEGEGIAGTIDLQTIKPLNQDGRVIQFNGTYEKTSFGKLNPDGDNDGLEGNFFYMDQFADDTLGVAFAYTTMTSPNQEKRWNAWGYPTFTYDDGSEGSILGGAKPFVRSSTLERDSAMLVIEAAPRDDLKMTFDALYVDFLDTKILRGIEVPFAWGQGSISADTAIIDPATGFVTSAITQGQRAVVRNDYEERDASLMSLGFNTNWAASDTWTLDFDVSYAKVKRDVYSVESYAGTGRGDNRGTADDLGYTFDSGNTGATFSHGLDYSDYNLIQLGGPLSWGWSGALNDKYGVTGTEYENQLQDGFINTPSIDDELTTLKFAASQEIDSDFITDITYGIAYRERVKDNRSKGYYMTASSFSYPDNTGMQSVPEQYRLGSASLDFIGMGDMIAYDTMGLVNDGYYSLLDANLTDANRATRSWTINEKVTSTFIQAEIATEVAGMELSGNVGVRYIYTDQSSQGSASNVVNRLVVAEPTDVSYNYSNFLPSINLALKIDDEQSLRFGAAKTISRARLDEMNASYGASYNANQPDDNGNYWSVNGGNPSLKPKEAVGIDLSYENYFSDEGYFAVALFRKNISNWIFDGTYEVDMTGVADPATGIVPPADRSTATGSGKVNGGDGSLSGYEISATVPFNIMSESLDGFGVIASYTGLNSNLKDPDGKEYEIPGLSKSISTFTFYYDNNGFSARASMRKRSDFKGDVYGISFETVQVDIVGETIWDAQIGFDFGEAGIKSLDGLSIFLQGYNLNKEPFTSLQGDNALQVRDYQDYGSSYLLGFSYKM